LQQARVVTSRNTPPDIEGMEMVARWLGLPYRSFVEPGRNRPAVQHPPDLGQLAGDLGRSLALGEQVGGLQAAAFQPFHISRVPQHPAIG
jgi:hypothetical protein